MQRALAALRAACRRSSRRSWPRPRCTQQRTGELAAERDHELRNGLAGLAGITHLLSADGREHEPLKHAVLAELGRLHLILDGAADDPEEPDRAEPAVGLPGRTGADRAGHAAPVTAATGCGCGSSPGCGRAVTPTVLAQVVTNLLANCDRHAPGRDRHGRGAAGPTGWSSIGVRDEGPGLSGRVSGSVLDRGIRDESAGGSGLGLHISRQLSAREGGTLTLRTVEDPRGCLATVTLPPAGADRPAGAGSTSAGAPSGR